MATAAKVYDSNDYAHSLEHVGLRRYVCDVTLDSSYPTGGEALALATIAPDCLVLHSVTAMEYGTENGLFPKYDNTNAKLMIFRSETIEYTDSGSATVDVPTFKEAANTTDFSTLVIRVVAEYKTSITL